MVNSVCRCAKEEQSQKLNPVARSRKPPSGDEGNIPRIEQTSFYPTQKWKKKGSERYCSLYEIWGRSHSSNCDLSFLLFSPLCKGACPTPILKTNVVTASSLIRKEEFPQEKKLPKIFPPTLLFKARRKISIMEFSSFLEKFWREGKWGVLLIRCSLLLSI